MQMNLRAMWRKYANRFLGYDAASWKGLVSVCGSLFVKQTYIFVLIVPIIAGVFDSINATVKSFSIGGFSLSFPIVMPIKWELLFYSAVCFLVARALVSVSCPDEEFIKKGFVEFEKGRKTYIDLLRYTEKYSTYFDSTDELKKIKLTIDNNSQKSKVIYQEYLIFYDALNKYSQYMRLLIFHFLLLGYGLVVIVVTMNIASVVKL